MIFGIVGKYAAGKDTVADYLKQKGFAYYSCSDIIRDEHIKLFGVPPPDREAFIRLADQLRTEFGHGILAKKACEQLKADAPKNALIVSIRTPEELAELRGLSSFRLISVDAPIELRFERSVKRKSAKDHLPFEDFKAQEERELNAVGTLINLRKVIESADATIQNSGSLVDLYQQVDLLLSKQ